MRLAAYGAIERTVPRWPLAAVERLADRRARGIARHAYETVPFYREAMRERGLGPADFRRVADLELLPLIDGGFVQDNLDAFVSSAYGRERRKGFHTSGSSSGVRRVVFWDDRALLLRTARAERERRVLAALAGERWGTTILREFVRPGRGAVGTDGHRRLMIAPIDHAARTGRTLLSQRSLIPSRASHYEFASLEEPVEAIADRIERRRPRIVFSYGSYASQFFSYLAQAGRELPLPPVWVYMADVASDAARAIAANRGCTLWSVYSAVEGGSIAFQCELADSFHVNVDLCHLRVVGQSGRTLDAGQSGELVLSNLHNRAMVLLNYRQGDRGAMSPRRCPCGRSLPLLERLEGRTSEMVELPGGRSLSAVAIEGLFREALRPVRQLQIHQLSPTRLRWLLVTGPGVERARVRAEIRDRAAQVLGGEVALDVEFVARIETTEQGKAIPVVRH